MNPGETVTVHKLNASGVEVWTYPGRILSATPTSVTLEARYNGNDVDFHGLHLRHGDRFIETFFSDRGYNVFAVHDVESGHFKGWYCNITRPARLEDGHVRADDLALDLVVLPDGTAAVLDADEFDELPLDAAERAQAIGALEDLRRQAAARTGPFDRLSAPRDSSGPETPPAGAP